MRARNFSRLAWILCAAAIIGILINYAIGNNNSSGSGIPATLNDVTFALYNIVSAIIAALIISRQPRNTIGWLLMFFPFTIAMTWPLEFYLRQAAAQPNPGGPLFLLAAWIVSWSWWLLMGPFLLILLLFPTGRLPSPRWRWVPISLSAGFISFITLIAFLPVIEVEGIVDGVRNPIGFLSQSFFDVYVTIFQVVLLASAVGCVSAAFFRYRKAGPEEREQIKWLAYASVIFIAVYGVQFTAVGQEGDWLGTLFNLTIMAIPISIGIAILRYHLWDIDVLIRRTLSYAILTLSLGLVYFGSVIVLQRVTSQVFGESSQVVIVLSTLLIAALFTPLRRGIQSMIDRRFFRRKYNADQVLADYGVTTRNETDLEQLTGELARIIQETVQPESISIWLGKQKAH